MNTNDPTIITNPEITGFINHQALGEPGDKVTVELGEHRLVGTLHELAALSGQLTALLVTVAEARATAEAEALRPAYDFSQAAHPAPSVMRHRLAGTRDRILGGSAA